MDAVDGSTDVRFRFYIDDVRTHEYINTQPDSWNRTNPHEGWDIAINLAVGGNYTGHPSQQLGYLAYPDKCSLTYRAPTGGIGVSMHGPLSVSSRRSIGWTRCGC